MKVEEGKAGAGLPPNAEETKTATQNPTSAQMMKTTELESRGSPGLSDGFKRRLGQALEGRPRPRRVAAGESGKATKSTDVSAETEPETATPSYSTHK